MYAMEIKTCTIIGQGALGTLFGKMIRDRIGSDALLFLASEDRIRKYRSEGVYCNGERCDFGYVSPEVHAPADLAIFAVKGPVLKEAIKDARGQIGPETILISLLNGISSEDDIAAAYGWDRTLYSVAQGMDAVKFGNRLTFTKPGRIIFGDRTDERTAAVEAVAEFFSRAGIAYTVPDDIRRTVWNKFMLNVGVNQAVTAFETDYGGIHREGAARETMFAAMQEVIPIAAAEGIRLTENDISDWMKILAGFAADSMPSMRQDALAERKTEVELFAGTVIARAKPFGLPVPVNERLYRRIREIEAGYGA